MSEILTTPRLTLRPWRQGDVQRLAEIANHLEIWRRLRDVFPHPYTREHALRWVRQAESHPEQKNFAIEAQEGLVGGIGLWKRSDVYRKSAEIGYWLGVEFWGQGYATEAVRAVAEWGLGEWGLVRIQAGVFGENPRSQRVLEKSGFHLEARLKKSVFKAGEFLDEALYALIK